MVNTWSTDNNIVNGLNDSSLGYYTLPEVFSIGENTYLISASTSKVFSGFRLDGASWVSDSSIVSGMPSGVVSLAATVFNLSGTDYAIIGDNDGTWHGREWNGSTWINQPSIVSGLPALAPPYDNTPTAFYMNNELFLIYTAWSPAHFKGFKWNGSAWIEDASIISGISIPGYSYRLAVFLYGTKYKAIFGRWSQGGPTEVWYGFSREGSTWIVDNDIISGLTTQNYIFGGDVFTKDNNTYFIAGDWHTDVPNFYGFNAAANIISTILTVDTNECTEPCTINGTVSWTNDGGSVSAPTDLGIIVNGTQIPIAYAVTIGPGDTTPLYEFSLPNITADTYTIEASPNGGTDAQTIIVNPAPPTPSNIIAINMVPTPTTCIEPCDINIDVTYSNTGETIGIFTPEITIDGTSIMLAPDMLDPGATIIKTFSSTGILSGIHTICAVPLGTTTCQTMTVQSPPSGGAMILGLLGIAVLGIMMTTKSKKSEPSLHRDIQ
jgi:hypothetical protein